MNTRLHRRAVVVGAGVAGLASAALLARAGYETTVLEKAAGPGGRAAQFTRDGFTFDTGPTLLFMPDVFRTFFAACGADFDREVPIERLAINYRLHFGDGRRLELSPNLSRTMDSLEAFSPGCARRLLPYLAECARAYELSRRHFVGKRIRGFRDFLSPSAVKALVESGALRSLGRTARAAFGSPDAAAALSFQTMYLGMSPFASPELYRLLFFIELGEGIFFPRGGIGALVRGMERLALKCGATIIYNASVDDVEQRGNTVRAVFANGNSVPCDVVLFTADLPYVYARLLNEPRHRSTRMRLTPSALLIYVALNQRYPELQHHEFLMPIDLRRTCEDIFVRGCFPQDPAVYLAAPCATDPSMAPAGSEALYVLVPVPNLHGTIDWTAHTGTIVDSVFARIEERVLSDLRKRIRWHEVRTPLDFGENLNLHGGAAFGLAHDLLQIGPMRPDTRHRRLHNVYFAGASTRPATGLPLVTLGAMQTVDRICEELPA